MSSCQATPRQLQQVTILSPGLSKEGVGSNPVAMARGRPGWLWWGWSCPEGPSPGGTPRAWQGCKTLSKHTFTGKGAAEAGRGHGGACHCGSQDHCDLRDPQIMESNHWPDSGAAMPKPSVRKRAGPQRIVTQTLVCWCHKASPGWLIGDKTLVPRWSPSGLW